jgi:AbrB family looped-hinge helix DNA binding protein
VGSSPKELVIDGQPISTLSSSGQLLIPETIRSQMGLKAGDTLAFELKNGVLELKKVRIKLHYE